MSDYLYKTTPIGDQEEIFLSTRDEEQHAFLLEMGLGKSWLAINTAAWQFAQGVIDFFLIVAPSGVHTNWITEEIPKHMPDWTNCKYAEWGSTMKAKQRDAFAAVFDDLDNRTSLRAVAMNIEAFGIQERYYKEKAGKIARAIMNSFNVLVIVDESSFIKTAGINRTRRLITLGRYSKTRRLANGTPVTNGPLDLYAQYKFLAGPNQPLLGPYSLNKRSFDHHYAEWEEHTLKDGRRYPSLVGYRNIDELTGYIDLCSTRRTKAESLNLPPKLYSKIFCEMHPEQTKRYARAKKDGILQLKGEGNDVILDNVLTLWLRLQQIVGGFVPTDDPENTESECILDDYQDLPRFQEFLRHIEQVQTGKVIIVCRFLAECRMWLDYFNNKAETNYEAVSYLGKLHYQGGGEEREENKRRFQEDEAVQYMVMNKAGARGLTLVQAQSMFFYSNDFSLDTRLQTEDRPHRIGQENAVTYYDGVAEGTIDEKLVDAYRKKKKLADVITRDEPSKWL